MFKRYLLFALSCLFTSVYAQNINQPYDEKLLNRLRGKFIISGASHFYYPDLKYGGYLIPKEHINNQLCNNKKKGAFYMVDHEGGDVRRITSNTPSAQKSNDLTIEKYQQLWHEDMLTIKSYCIDSILGPTVDIGMGNGRSYSANLESNFKSIQPILDVSKKDGVLSVVKHFPGLLTKCDRVGKSKEQNYCDGDLKYIDKLWGKSLDTNPPKALMVSHYYYKTQKYQPALANEEILSYLRVNKKYSGVILTDALWELNNELTVDEIMNMYKYTDLVLMLDYKKIEKVIRYLHNEIKRNPQLETYLVDTETRIKQWR